jgi:hypothetical protein
MSKINTNLLNPKKIRYDRLLEEYNEAKNNMEGIPTAEKLKKLILATARLAKAREDLENEFPEA